MNICISAVDCNRISNRIELHHSPFLSLSPITLSLPANNFCPNMSMPFSSPLHYLPLFLPFSYFAIAYFALIFISFFSANRIDKQCFFPVCSLLVSVFCQLVSFCVSANRLLSLSCPFDRWLIS